MVTTLRVGTSPFLNSLVPLICDDTVVMDFSTPAINTLLPEPEFIITKQDIHDILPDSCAIHTKSGAMVVARTRHLERGDKVEEGLPVIVLIHGYPQS